MHERILVGLLLAVMFVSLFTGCSLKPAYMDDITDNVSGLPAETSHEADTGHGSLDNVDLSVIDQPVSMEYRYSGYQAAIKKASEAGLPYILEEDKETYFAERPDNINRTLYWLYDGVDLYPRVGFYNYINTEGVSSDSAELRYEYMTDVENGFTYRLIPQIADYSLSCENVIERAVFDWTRENTVFDDISNITFNCSYKLCVTDAVDVDSLDVKTVLKLLSDVFFKQRKLAEDNRNIYTSFSQYTILISSDSLRPGATKEQCDTDLCRMADEFPNIVGGWGMRCGSSFTDPDSQVWLSFYPDDEFYTSAGVTDYWSSSFADISDESFAKMVRDK